MPLRRTIIVCSVAIIYTASDILSAGSLLAPPGSAEMSEPTPGAHSHKILDFFRNFLPHSQPAEPLPSRNTPLVQTPQRVLPRNHKKFNQALVEIAQRISPRGEYPFLYLKTFYDPQPVYLLKTMAVMYGSTPVLFDVWFSNISNKTALHISPHINDFIGDETLQDNLCSSSGVSNYPGGVPGTIGRIWFSYSHDKVTRKPIMYVNEIQSTLGFNHLPPLYHRLYKFWIETGIVILLDIAEELGYEALYVRKETGHDIPLKINGNPYYRDPFVGFETVTVEILRPLRTTYTVEQFWKLEFAAARERMKRLYSTPHIIKVSFDTLPTVAIHRPLAEPFSINATVTFDKPLRDIGELEARVRFRRTNNTSVNRKGEWITEPMKIMPAPQTSCYRCSYVLPAGFRGSYYVEYRIAQRQWIALFEPVKVNWWHGPKIIQPADNTGPRISFTLNLGHAQVTAPEKQCLVRLWASDKSRPNRTGGWRFYNGRFDFCGIDGTLVFTITLPRQFIGEGTVQYSVDGGKTWVRATSGMGDILTIHPARVSEETVTAM
jgi:hypothetical protein